MDVTQCPVLVAGVEQLGDRARAVGVVVGVAAGVAVQKRYLKAVLAGPREAARQVVALLLLCVADAVNGGQCGAVAFRRGRGDLVAAEDGDRLGPAADAGPSLVERIVVAVHDEDRHARLRETLQTMQEAELGPHAPFGAVVDVAGQEKEGGLLTQGELDEPVPGVQ